MYYGEAMERHSANLCEKLRERIRSYKVAHPGLSSSQIAKSFNISSSAFGRLENGDIRFPSLDLVLRVLRGTGCKNILQYLEEYFPEIAKTYKEVYSANDGAVFVDTSIEKYFEDPDTFIYMLLAYTDSGFVKTDIEELFGLSGLVAVDMMIADGAIVEKNGRIYGSDNLVRMSAKSAKKLALNTLEHSYDPRNDYDSYLRIFSNSVNFEKVHPQILSILKDAEIKINDILNDRENIGDDCYYSLLSSGSVIKSSKGGMH